MPSWSARRLEEWAIAYLEGNVRDGVIRLVSGVPATERRAERTIRPLGAAEGVSPRLPSSNLRAQGWEHGRQFRPDRFPRRNHSLQQ